MFCKIISVNWNFAFYNNVNDDDNDNELTVCSGADIVQLSI